MFGRIVTAAAVFSVVAAGGAAAQSAADSSSGKPISLLRFLVTPTKADHADVRAKHHRRSARRRIGRLHVATARWRHRVRIARLHHPAEVAESPSPADIWPAAPAPGAAVAAAVVASRTLPIGPVAAEPASGEAAVGGDAGRTIEIASPQDVDAFALAAKDQSPAAGAAPAINATQAADAAPVSAPDASPASAPDTMATSAPDTAAAGTPDDAAAAAPESTPVTVTKSDMLKLASATAVVVPAEQRPSPVGSASWIAQVLAALGGAVAAGAGAWFLIGSAPQRMHG